MRAINRPHNYHGITSSIKTYKVSDEFGIDLLD